MTIAKKLSTNLAVVLFVLYLRSPARAQTLIYSVSYAETRTSFHARYPNGAFRASTNEKLAMLRSFRKTEIYSVSMIDGTRSLLFSDEGMNLDIKPTGPIYGTDKALVTGVRRANGELRQPRALLPTLERSTKSTSMVQGNFANFLRPSQTSHLPC
jgi:hypothetical protein